MKWSSAIYSEFFPHNSVLSIDELQTSWMKCWIWFDSAPSSGWNLCSLPSASWTWNFGWDHWAQGSSQIPVQLLVGTSYSKGELQNKPYWIEGMSYALYIPYLQLGSNHCSPHNNRGKVFPFTRPCGICTTELIQSKTMEKSKCFSG